MHLACFAPRGAWFQRAAEAAASVAEFKVRSFRRISFATEMRAFARWCRANRIAVVHTTELYTQHLRFAGRGARCVPARIGNRRELNPDKTAAQIAMQRAAYACAHAIVANSHAAANRLIAEHVPAHKLRIIPNGLDFDRVVPRLEREAAQGDRRRDSAARKGHDVLIDAAGEVLRHFPDATFEIVGDGRELQALVARAEARGVRHAFTFLGHRDDVAQRLAGADIFVLPSRSEAFPNAVLEAMAAGMPIVASGIGGILELIDDGRNGLLAPPERRRALAGSIVRLMADPPLASRLARAARERALARYSFDRMVGAFQHLYLDQLTRRGLLVTEQPWLAASDMCGIAGKFNFDRARPIDRERLSAMTSVIAHRGPDADGYYVADGIGLGHRRLSIIDLSTGDQPLANEDRTIWVVFNGEIYNFTDIRESSNRRVIASTRIRTPR